MSRGIPIVISAPSGCGKDAILGLLYKMNENLKQSVSATTRNMRNGEVDGVDYIFCSREKFEQMIKDNEVLEYTEYCGNYYGTPKQAVNQLLDSGKDVILKIEVEGAMNIKRIFPECVSVFVIPPSFTELERRLRKRGTDDEESIAKRIAQARVEIGFADKFDYIITNAELEKAADDLNMIILSEKLKSARRIEALNKVINS